MCGRYYVDGYTAREIEKVIRLVQGEENRDSITLRTGDIHPTETAPVLAASAQGLCCRWLRWGFPGQQLIINARSETVLEKKMFRESVEHRRIAIPAAGFYEWNRNKEKNTFCRKNRPVLFMAGFYNRYQDEDRFVILTTGANASMQPVHDRMPLILEPEEILPWIGNPGQTDSFLHKEPCLLERRTDYEQMSLF